MARCDNCKGLLLISRTSFAGGTFCGAGCVEKFKIALTERVVPAAALADEITKIHMAACPVCKGPGPLDVYEANKATGMLVAYQVKTLKRLSCAKCGRSLKLQAAAHCFFLGWWGLHAAVHTLVYLPKNLIGAVAAKPAPEPSQQLTRLVKIRLAEASAQALQAAASES